MIDISSNSIRYQEAAIYDEQPYYFAKSLATTRLACGIMEDGCLSTHAMARSLHAIREFCMAARAKALPIYAYATSAVREAATRAAFGAMVKRDCGIPLDIRSGEAVGLLAHFGSGGWV